HMISVAEQGIGQAVVAYIHQDINIISADGFIDHAFCLAGTETRGLRLQDITASFIAFIFSDIIFAFGAAAAGSPFYQVVVYFFAKRKAAGQWNDSQAADRQCLKISFVFLTHGHVPPKSFFWIRISLPNSLIIV